MQLVIEIPAREEQIAFNRKRWAEILDDETLFETDEGWSASCLDLPGCHSQGSTRPEALDAIRGAISDWLIVEAEESRLL